MKLHHTLCLGLLALPLFVAAAPSVQRPLILGLVTPSADLAGLSQRLRATAQVPVLRLNALSDSQISLTLKCKSARQCDAAQARLQAATSWVSSVDVDAVRTLPKPVRAAPAASAALAR
jgi:hypothetical protein